MAATPDKQILDAGPRGSADLEIMSALSTGKKNKLCFFKHDHQNNTTASIGEHTVFDLQGAPQNVGMVQTWNQCNEMLLTSHDKKEALILMDTERGAVKSELSIKRQQKNWKLRIDSITPMQKFEQYKQSQQYQLFGLGDEGHTVFGMSHDSRANENVQEFVIAADSHRKYKSYTFTCHAQTKAGFLVLGRTDGAIALYDYIMQSENASCVISGMPGPVTSVDVAADGSMIAWTTPDFVFFTCPSTKNWEKGTKEPKPPVLKLGVSPADEEDLPDCPAWKAVKFDAATHSDAVGVIERWICTFSGALQVRWRVEEAREAWSALNEEGGEGGPTVHFGETEVLGGCVSRHMTVKDDVDVMALEGDIVKSLRF